MWAKRVQLTWRCEDPLQTNLVVPATSIEYHLRNCSFCRLRFEEMTGVNLEHGPVSVAVTDSVEDPNDGPLRA